MNSYLLQFFLGCAIALSAWSCNKGQGNNGETMELSEIILYAEEHACKKLADFYHVEIGIPIKFMSDSAFWVEFEGTRTRLCIHRNNKREEPYQSGAVHIVLLLENTKKVESLYASLVDRGYEKKEIHGKGREKHLEPGEISEVFKLNAHAGGDLSTFWISDPVGNILQVEAR